MIYTVTLNPSLDYLTVVDDFNLYKTNRTKMEALVPGGKGLNVSTVLANLGVESMALGFVAGFTGRELEKRVQELGFDSDFVYAAEGMTRINVKVINYDGTEINGMGPWITESELAVFWEKLDALDCGDYLVLAGSSPKGVPGTIYRDIMMRLQRKKVSVIVDAGDALLESVLEYAPFLVKPNHHELGGLFGVEIETKEQAVYYAQLLRGRGARNVLVSMGGAGAVLVDETDTVHMLEAPAGKVVNSVGAGDSMVAGFLAGFAGSGDYGLAFRKGVAAGSATAFSEGLATGEDIEKLEGAF